MVSVFYEVHPDHHMHSQFASFKFCFFNKVLNSFKSHKFLQDISVSCPKLMHPNPSSPEAISTLLIVYLINKSRDFFSDPVVKTPLSSTRDMSSIPGWGIETLHAECCV